MESLLIPIAAFVGVAALVGGLSLLFRDATENKVEDRLELLTGARAPAGSKDGLLKDSVLAHPLDAVPGIFEAVVARFKRLRLLFEQADTTLTPQKFFMISGILALGGMGVSGYARV